MQISKMDYDSAVGKSTTVLYEHASHRLFNFALQQKH